MNPPASYSGTGASPRREDHSNAGRFPRNRWLLVAFFGAMAAGFPVTLPAADTEVTIEYVGPRKADNPYETTVQLPLRFNGPGDKRTVKVKTQSNYEFKGSFTWENESSAVTITGLNSADKKSEVDLEFEWHADGDPVKFDAIIKGIVVPKGAGGGGDPPDMNFKLKAMLRYVYCQLETKEDSPHKITELIMAAGTSTNVVGRLIVGDGEVPDDTSTLKLEMPAELGTVSPSNESTTTGGKVEFAITAADAGVGPQKIKLTNPKIVHQSAPQDPASGTARPAEVDMTVPKVKTQTVATTPADRTRTTIGVGEEVVCSILPASIGSVTWSVSEGGIVKPLSGTSTTFTASQAATTSIVTATLPNGVKCTKTFTVIAPTGIVLAPANNNIWHVHNTCSAGFFATGKLTPNTVSFYNIQFQEQEVLAVASGFYEVQNGRSRHPKGRWVDVLQDNSADGQDQIRSDVRNPPYRVGLFTWSIPYRYRLKKGVGAGIQFKIVDQVKASTDTGQCTVSKGGASRSRVPNDPTSGF